MGPEPVLGTVREQPVGRALRARNLRVFKELLPPAASDVLALHLVTGMGRDTGHIVASRHPGIPLVDMHERLTGTCTIVGTRVVPGRSRVARVTGGLAHPGDEPPEVLAGRREVIGQLILPFGMIPRNHQVIILVRGVHRQHEIGRSLLDGQPGWIVGDNIQPAILVAERADRVEGGTCSNHDAPLLPCS